MKAQLKPLAEQVIVVTGSTSGHGLATARNAAEAGAKILLIARDEDALTKCRDDIRAKGGTAEYFVADVGVEEQVEAAARFAIERFGGFDTWVNNAGIGIYATALETPTEDHRRIFDTNYWGMVYGSLAAVRHLKGRTGGGALINVGSINSDMPSPLLSAYSATKHAVKGFTDSLRLEMMSDDAPISITLVKPGPIGTPFPEHGRNLTGKKAVLPPPVYSPELVANAILRAAVRPRRSVTIGGAGKIEVLGATMMPWLFDQIASRMDKALLDQDRPIGKQPGNLFEPQGDDGRVDGEQKGREFSAFAMVGAYPVAAVSAVAALGAVAGFLLVRSSRSDRLSDDRYADAPRFAGVVTTDRVSPVF